MSVLAERKRKTKWVINPTKKPLWETDSNTMKFGKELMEKMGWSVGKGLGVDEQGIQEPLKVSFKNDTKGIGFKGNDDDWIEQQDEYNDLLNQLRNNSDFYVTEISEKEKEIKSLEEKSKKSKARVHYQKFTRSKDLSRYSDNDLACIFGTSKAKKEKLKTEETIQTESEVVGNCETSFGITTINSGSIQNYFKKKWIFNKKSNDSSNKNEGDINITDENYSDGKLCFIKNEQSLKSESEEEEFKRRKCKSNFDEKCLKRNRNNTSQLDEGECLENNVKRKKKKKEIQDINSEDFKIKKIKEKCDDNNVFVDENFQKHKTHLMDNLGYKGSKNFISNEISDCDLVREKNYLQSNDFEDEKKHNCAARNKRKKIHENCCASEISSLEKLNEISEKECLFDIEATEKRKKKKLKKEKLKEMGEINNEEFCYVSAASFSRLNDDEVGEFCMDINSVKKKKKQKKEKFLNDKDTENKYFNDDKNEFFNNHNQEQINETTVRVKSAEKNKRKKFKKEESEEEEKSINYSTGLLKKENLGEELRENNINTFKPENVRGIQSIVEKKRKKDKKEKLGEKEKAGGKLFYGSTEKSILEETSNEKSINQIIIDADKQENTLEVESCQKNKKKHKKEKKKTKEREKEKKESINCCGDRVDGFNAEIANVLKENTLGVELSKKKKKKKKDETEKLDGKEKADMDYHYDGIEKPTLEETLRKKNISELVIDSNKTESVTKKKKEKEKSTENTENEISKKSCEYKQRENKEKAQEQGKIKKPNHEMVDKNISQKHENNVSDCKTNDQLEEGKGVHKHKVELLNEKRADKFYPGQHTVNRILRLIYWSNIAGFKGSNLGTVMGYGFLKKSKSNKSNV